MSEWIACERCGFRGWIPNDYHGCLRWPSGLAEAAFACASPRGGELVWATRCDPHWHPLPAHTCSATDALP